MHKTWTQEEEEFLKANYKKMSYQEIGLILNRKITQVQNKKTKLGLNSKKVIFSKKEYDFIGDNFPQLSVKTISEKLGIEKTRVRSIIQVLKINAKKTFFKHDYLSIPAIHKILNVSKDLLRSLIKCKFIRISLFKVQKRKSMHLIHIDEFEKIKDFLNNYIEKKEFAKQVCFCLSSISYRIKTGKIKNFLKVGSKYFIHKSEIEIQRSL